MSKHTPGPWTFHVRDDGDDLEIVGPDGEGVVNGCGCCGSPFMENVHDAPVLAAAPKLLEVVEMLAEALECARARLGICGPGDGADRKADADDVPGASYALEIARTIVAEATGGTNKIVEVDDE